MANKIIRLASSERAMLSYEDKHIGAIWDVHGDLFINIEIVGNFMLLNVDGDSFHIYVTKIEIVNISYDEVLESFEMKDFELVHKEFEINKEGK